MIFFAGLTTTGCASAPPVAGPTHTSATASPQVSARTSPQASPVLAGVSRERADFSPETQRPSEPAQLAVVGVRVDSHDGVDRIVVDLDGAGEPGWFVDYVDTPMQVAAGKPLAVSGDAFLNINVDGTVHPAELGVTDTIPVTLAASSSSVVEVVSGGTSEGRTQLVVGLERKVPYTVRVLENPKRLVLELGG